MNGEGLMQICIFLIPSRKSTRAAANISVILAIIIGFRSLAFLSIANADERLTLTQSDVVAGSDTPASSLPMPVLGPKLGDYILLSGGEVLLGSQSSLEPDEKPE
ncbi:MAG: hypothetical protein KDB01_07990, partial [Planctomycetaceae bacterium]|nr:hypothetical protein [Planctomycetaceae bacterium]